MKLEELKKQIKEYPNRSKEYLSIMHNRNYSPNMFYVETALYQLGVNLNGVLSLEDLYDSIKDANEEILNFPYYLDIHIGDFSNEDTINIINNIDSSIPIVITTFEFLPDEFLGKLTNHNVYFKSHGYITLSQVKRINEEFNFDNESQPLITIDKIDDTTEYFINYCYENFANSQFRFDIKDKESLKRLKDIVPLIDSKKIVIFLSDDLFSEKNSNNARELLLDIDNYNLYDVDNKEIWISYKGLEYEDLKSIFEFEKYLEIIKSHIPDDASDLDKVTYVSIFIINYFKYDYDMYRRIINRAKSEGIYKDINLATFISRGKGVCRHFALFTESILKDLNVECEFVTAYDDKDPDDEGHAFNVVTIDGKKTWLDNTWLASSFLSGRVNSLAESSNFLRSKENFNHDEYASTLDEYDCVDIDREEINASVARVLSWNKLYQIHRLALLDLFNKFRKKKDIEKTVEEKIEASIPGRR